MRTYRNEGGDCVIGDISVAQRFSSDLKLNLHWHLLLADGVWHERHGQVQFYPAEPLETIRVQETLHDAVLRVTKALTPRGWQHREDDPFTEQDPGLSALWRAAPLGRPIDPATEQPKRAGLKTLPKPDGCGCARYQGFSPHAHTTVGPAAHDDRHRLVKYLSRPSVSAQRVQAGTHGRCELALNTPRRDCTQCIAPQVRQRHRPHGEETDRPSDNVALTAHRPTLLAACTPSLWLLPKLRRNTR